MYTAWDTERRVGRSPEPGSALSEKPLYVLRESCDQSPGCLILSLHLLALCDNSKHASKHSKHHVCHQSENTNSKRQLVVG